MAAGQVDLLGPLHTLVRDVTERAVTSNGYELAAMPWSLNRLGNKRVKLDEVMSISAQAEWFHRAAVKPALDDVEFADPRQAIICEKSPLDVILDIRSRSGGVQIPFVLVGEVNEFDSVGSIDSSRPGALTPSDLLLRTDFARFVESTIKHPRQGFEEGVDTVESRLRSKSNALLARCQQVVLFRGPPEQGYPFLEEPAHISLLLTAMSDKTPKTRTVFYKKRGKVEWYQDPRSYSALLERLSLIGDLAAQECSADGSKPVLILTAPGCGGAFRQPEGAVAAALKHFRRKYSTCFEQIFICCRGRGGGDFKMASRLRDVVNRQPGVARTGRQGAAVATVKEGVAAKDDADSGLSEDSAEDVADYSIKLHQETVQKMKEAQPWKTSVDCQSGDQASKTQVVWTAKDVAAFIRDRSQSKPGEELQEAQLLTDRMAALGELLRTKSSEGYDAGPSALVREVDLDIDAGSNSTLDVADIDEYPCPMRRCVTTGNAPTLASAGSFGSAAGQVLARGLTEPLGAARRSSVALIQAKALARRSSLSLQSDAKIESKSYQRRSSISGALGNDDCIVVTNEPTGGAKPTGLSLNKPELGRDVRVEGRGKGHQVLVSEVGLLARSAARERLRRPSCTVPYGTPLTSMSELGQDADGRPGSADDPRPCSDGKGMQPAATTEVAKAPQNDALSRRMAGDSGQSGHQQSLVRDDAASPHTEKPYEAQGCRRQSVLFAPNLNRQAQEEASHVYQRSNKGTKNGSLEDRCISLEGEVVDLANRVNTSLDHLRQSRGCTIMRPHW